MTYAEALRAARLAISFPPMSRKHVMHWNALEDALNALPFPQFEAIYTRAKQDETPAAFAIVCMCE